MSPVKESGLIPRGVDIPEGFVSRKEVVPKRWEGEDGRLVSEEAPAVTLVVFRHRGQSQFKPPQSLNFVLFLNRLLNIYHCQRHRCQALGHATSGIRELIVWWGRQTYK